MNDIRTHRRILDTFTGPLERRLLHWIAARLPGWVTPDVLTAVGVIGGLIIFAAYLLSQRSPAFLWLASFGFVVNWFGDSLDGTLARVRKIERPVYGFYIDHAVDAYIEILVFLGLGLSPYVRFDLAAAALIAYMLLSVLVYLRTCVKGEFTISYGRLGPTEARLIAIGANTLVFFIGNPRLQLFSMNLTIYDWVVAAITGLIGVIAVLTTIRQARILAVADGRSPRKSAPDAPASRPAGRRHSTRKKNRDRLAAGSRSAVGRTSPTHPHRTSGTG